MDNGRLMVLTIILWFMFAVVSVSSETASSENTSEDWPYTDTKNASSLQSPLDIYIKDLKTRYLPLLRYFNYHTFDNAEMEITNNHHTVVVKFHNKPEKIPYITGGPLFHRQYQFEQMHFHWGDNDYGSEHRINGYMYAMEIHIVHIKKKFGTLKEAQEHKDGVCVVAFFAEISPYDNPDISNFIADLKYIDKPGTTIVRSFKTHFKWMIKIITNQHYITYHGSLTTEPFTECVTWILLTNPLKISRAQLSEFRKLCSNENGTLIKHNDRPLQNLNHREIIYVY